MPYLTTRKNQKLQLSPGLVASYAIQPGNGVGLFWDTTHTPAKYGWRQDKSPKVTEIKCIKFVWSTELTRNAVKKIIGIYCKQLKVLMKDVDFRLTYRKQKGLSLEPNWSACHMFANFARIKSCNYSVCVAGIKL